MVQRQISSRTARGVSVDDGRAAGRVYEALKRLADVVLATVLLIVLSPLLLFIAAAIRLTSRGPAMFRQIRIGRDGEPFVLLKFRTMYDGNDDSEHRAYVARMLEGEPVSVDPRTGLYKLDDHDRITSVGRVLRRASLDELPQLLNVLAGDMTFVGPRPALPWEAERFPTEYRVRFSVKPGITGLWQVNGRNALTMLEGLQLDAEYVRRRSLWLDVLLLLRTIPNVILGRGAW